MKKIINKITLLSLFLFSAQVTQPLSSLAMTLATAAGLATLQFYKQSIEPRSKLHSLVSLEASDGAEILGKAIAQATQQRAHKQILFGVSSACSQNESASGLSTTSDEYITQHKPENVIWPSVGDACLSDLHWRDDNKKIQVLGCDMYRFSVDWSRIQPKNAAEFDQEVLDRYKDQCRDLIARGIIPLVCFHHYSDPIWFMDAGGFETRENTDLFVQFAEKVIETLGEAGAKHWLVMNQPLAYINKGYVVAMQPPFKKGIFKNPWKESVRNNIFAAHTEIFEKVKNMNTRITEQQEKHKVGISHQITPMRAHRYWNIIDSFIAYVADRSYNGFFLKFAAEHKNDFDFMALSFYSPCRFRLQLFPPAVSQNAFWDSERIGNETGDEGRIIDAQGFYDATVRVADAIGKDKPIIVIESGLDADESTPAGTALRINYFNQTMSALIKTIKDGYNIVGFCVWGLMDNYEWTKGYNAHFGLYTRRTDSKNMGELKSGGRYYQKIILAYHREMAHIEQKKVLSSL